jgi:phosphoribosyl-ATP pyrophosphohydrolase/phosphoribosyl-ATP pyrophosphohydrolase/phosphoribosyl-AMP cyclohydrolase
MNFLMELEQLLRDRRNNLPENSYTATLFRDGIDRILKKVGEEAGEVIIAAKNGARNELIHEIADLLFHVQVLLVNEELSLADIASELKRRHQ